MCVGRQVARNARAQAVAIAGLSATCSPTLADRQDCMKGVLALWNAADILEVRFCMM